MTHKPEGLPDKSFDPMRYLDAPCEYKVGTDERFRVQQVRAVYLREIHVEGDNLEAVEGFQGAIKEIEYGPRMGVLWGIWTDRTPE